MKNLSLVLFVTATIIGCGSSQKKPTEVKPAAVVQPALPTTLDEAVNSPFRNPENTVRDQYRHPMETLTFFGIRPEMTVVEIAPGRGWYMEILAPYLIEKGVYIAATPPSESSAYMAELNAKTAAWIGQYPKIKEKAQITTFNPKENIGIAPAGSADMVLTFRNVHNWMSAGAEQAAFNEFFKALKPGGILGVVEHRANSKAKPDPKSGYVHENAVIKMAQKAGFKLVAKSEINANPKDTKDHPEGVWTLPPALRLGDKDKEKYLAMGESDRMTLKFVKPLKKK